MMNKAIFLFKALQIITTAFLIAISIITLIKIGRLQVEPLNVSQLHALLAGNSEGKVEYLFNESQMAIVGLEHNLQALAKWILVVSCINVVLIGIESLIIVKKVKQMMQP